MASHDSPQLAVKIVMRGSLLPSNDDGSSCCYHIKRLLQVYVYMYCMYGVLIVFVYTKEVSHHAFFNFGT